MTSPGVGTTGRRLGRYHLAEPLGGGPTGEVFRAKVYGVAGFEREFAVKRFHPGFVSDPQIAAKLAAAARSYGSLEHPRIARLHEHGVAGGETFTATELVQGMDAARLVSMLPTIDQTLPPGAAIALVSQAARAVGYAHGRGIFHLGLCPTNLLATPDGDVKITDFCFLPIRAPARPGDDPTLRARMPYFAPEQLVGEPTGAATDVYQLGVIAYEVLTGRQPFTGATSPEIAQQILASRPRVPNLPMPVLEVVQRCLRRSPFERYPDARALADALDAAVRTAQLPGDHRDLAVVVRALLAKLEEVSDGQSSGAVSFPLPSPPLSSGPTGADSTAHLPLFSPEGAPASIGVAASAALGSAAATTRMDGLQALDDDAGALQELSYLDEDMPTTLRPRDDEGIKPPVGQSARARLTPPAGAAAAQRRQPGGGAPPGGRPPGPGPGPGMAGRPAMPPGGGPRPTAPPNAMAGAMPGRRAPTGTLPGAMAGAPVLAEEVDSAALEAAVPLGQPLGGNPAGGPGFSGGERTVIGVPAIGPAGNPTGRPGAPPGLAPGMPPGPPTGTPPRPPTGAPRPPTGMPPRVPGSAAPGSAPPGSVPPGSVPPGSSQIPGMPSLRPPGARPSDDPLLTPLPTPDRASSGALSDNMPLPSPPRSAIMPAALGIPEVDNPDDFDGALRTPEQSADFGEEAIHTALHTRPSKRVLWALGAFLLLAVAGGGYLVYLRFLAGDEVAAIEPAPGDAGAGTAAPGNGTPGAGTAKAAPGASPEATPAAGADVKRDAGAAAPGTEQAGSKPRSGQGEAVGGTLEMQDTPADKLVIRSEPERAKVYLDGSLQGNTPLTLDATTDQHGLAVIMPGHRLFTAEIKGHGTVDIKLEEVAPPGGEGGVKIRCRKKNRYYVFLDGNDSGQLCPSERMGVDPGEHVIEIYDPETESRQEFRLNVDQTRRSVRLRVD
jgi:serine/threonine protein kinase